MVMKLIHEATLQVHYCMADSERGFVAVVLYFK